MQSTGKEIYAALLTPFDRELALDTRLLASHARDVLGSGCTGVSPFGRPARRRPSPSPSACTASKRCSTVGFPRRN